MDLVLCKICGERHRLGFCPDVDPSIPPRGRDAGANRPVPGQRGSGAVAQEAPERSLGHLPVTGGSGGGAAAPNPDAAPSSIYKEKANRGRPLDKDRHRAAEVTKPWQQQGMSRRTWYRRQHAKA